MNENKNIVLIINMRNPYNIMTSIKIFRIFNRCSAYIKCNENSSDEDILKDILYYQNCSINLHKKYKGRSIIIYYDEIIDNPTTILKKITDFLDIDYVKELTNMVNIEKKESNIFPKEYINLIYSEIDKDNLIYFKKYFDNI